MMRMLIVADDSLVLYAISSRHLVRITANLPTIPHYRTPSEADAHLLWTNPLPLLDPLNRGVAAATNVVKSTAAREGTVFVAAMARGSPQS
ncbi:uncharacterized protein LDX57_000798 [Aspergillus melleus]|uniref:uncharacterized protein n=1 Tax=Aspergillus melleus TaxID=138277 RepID=UPI001E8E4448|nr:uncharacterized protein LDX57_000798 [Aspergillus melleus]KAH8423042.1 hypothetical protein LDX57_000798 [Aspergillus melleus]